MTDKPIVALDFATKAEIDHFLTQMQTDDSLYVKIGMELFYAGGQHLLYELKTQGHQIFLDLKLHDIPNTVKSAMKVLAGLEVDMVNVHAAGGRAMMEAAKEGLISGSGTKVPKIIAVTQLTSTSEAAMQEEQLISASLNDSVVHYSRLAQEAELDGVVCSAKEAGLIKAATDPEFLCVTPGIRLKSDSVDDQKRVVTPKEARELGASSIVVGRSITKAKSPLKAYQQIVEEWGN